METHQTIDSLLLDHEFGVRLGLFLGLLVVLALLEARFPRRRLTAQKPVRWYSNLGLSSLNSILLRWLFPLLAIGAATVAQDLHWGLFNNVPAFYVVAFVASFMALDFVIYLQHIVFHRVPWLWRLHRVHHSDVDLDVTSAVRFHFLESLISMGIKVAAVFLIGPPVLAVLFFEVWLNATAMFHHANLRLHPKVDRVLRWLIVTPDMHRIHHSVVRKETDSNFAFNLSLWDRLLGTYRDQPEGGHEAMRIGIEQFRGPRDQHLDRLLLQPLLSQEAHPRGRPPASPGDTSAATMMTDDTGRRKIGSR